VAPVLSVQWDGPPALPLHAALAWRGAASIPVDARAQVQVNMKAEDLGSLDPVLLPLLFELGLGVVDHYEPAQWTGSAGATPLPWLTAWGEVAYAAWSALEPNVSKVIDIHVESPLYEVADDVFSETDPLAATFQDTLSWRVGVEVTPRPWDLEGPADHLALAVRFAGGIDPSPLVSQSPSSALLDADRLVLAGGVEWEHRDPLGWFDRVRWTLFGQAHRLASGSYDRPDPAVPTAGYPRQAEGGVTSIPVGGTLWTAGATMGVEY
jgi:hypothetical protein